MQRRGSRFAIDLPLLYRREDTGAWRPGRLDNISCSGLLFVSPEKLPERSTLELALHVPVEIAGAGLVQLRCRGRAVRTANADGGQATGVAITEYRLTCNNQAHAPEQALLAQHEFGNQMEIVVGFAELLISRTDLPEDARQQLSKLLQAALRASQVRHEWALPPMRRE